MCIVRFFKKHGGRWATLAKYTNIPTSGRTDNTLKNRWYSGGLARRHQAGEYKDLPAWDDSCVESSSNSSDKFAPPPAVAAAAAAVAARKKQRGPSRASQADFNLRNTNANDDGDDDKAPVVIAAMPSSKSAPSQNTRDKAAAPGVVRPQLKRSAMELIKQAAAVIQAVAAKRSADDKQATLKAEAAAAAAKPAEKKAAHPRKAPSAIVNNGAAATATAAAAKPAVKKAAAPRKATSAIVNHAKNKKLNVPTKAATAKTSATIATKAHAGPKAGLTSAQPPPPPPPPSTRNRRRKQAKPASTLDDVPPVSPPPALKKSVTALGVVELEAGLGKRKRKAPSRFSNFTALSPLLNKRRAVDSTDEDDSDSDEGRCTDHQQQQQVEQKQVEQQLVEQKQSHTAGFSPSLNSYFKGNNSTINKGTFISPSFPQNEYNMPTDIVKKLSENEYSIPRPHKAALLPGLMVDKLFSDAAKIRPPPSTSGGSTALQQQQQQGCGFFPLSIFNKQNKKKQQQQQQQQEQLEQIVEVGDITGTKITLEKDADGTTDNANTKAGDKKHLPTPTTMIDITQGPFEMDGLPLPLSQQQQQYAVPMRKLSPLMDLTVNNNATAATAIKMGTTTAGGGGGGSDVLKTSQTDSLSSPELKSVVTQCLRVAVNPGGGAGSTPMNVGALRNSLLQLVTERKVDIKSNASAITKYHLTALNGGGIKSHAIPVDAEMVNSPVGEAAMKGFLDQATANEATANNNK
jgi:histone H1/5